MKFVIAIDSFKGSMTSVEAGNAARDGILKACPTAEVIVKPIADGGEGTVDALISGLNGTKRDVFVSNPLGRKIKTEYGIIGDTAVIEMSAASGIALIEKSELNPLVTTTLGVGEMILDAIKYGCRNFIIGIGGSATNDGGIGMLSALGYEFLDKDGNKVELSGGGLENIMDIKTEKVLPELAECTFNVACDVTNPLCGENGCSAIFGPQKGATPDDIIRLDIGMKNYAKITKQKISFIDENFPGAGAAGGLGFAFMAYLNGKLKSGIKLILEQINLEESIKWADFVITGEGRLDAQTFMGKAPAGIAELAKKHQKPVLAFAGCVTDDAVLCNEHGIDALFPIVQGACTLEEAMDNNTARNNMTKTLEQVTRLIFSFK
ncbi:MAG: glycerate kinase [Clostridia bacterium]|nr:glycerate kinase [Clostridia bacterium]